uniref:Cap-specific mRNA (nucleoside-2'-O-)-methyltransferase 1 n=1 Tax=Panagrellus redivivus TaxID=6233 RepID=A0A7E4VZ18_PANRE
MHTRRGNGRYPRPNNHHPQINGPQVAMPEDVIGRQRIQERPTLLECSPRRRDMLLGTDMKEWMTFGSEKDFTETPADFIDADQLAQFLKLTQQKHEEHISEQVKFTLHNRANPYEDIRNLCFVSRCGPKLASLDKMFDFRITGETDYKKRAAKTPIVDGLHADNTLSRDDPPFIFADIGGAPGGFSDYILWRKGFYNAKGFVSFATSERSFGYNHSRMLPGNAECLDFHTGPVENGNHNCVENVDAYINHVKSELRRHNPDGEETVDFVGAFMCLTRDGHEMEQEFRHEKMLLGNIVTGLSLLKLNGNMLVRVFDLFTPVTVGLVYCLYLAFKQIAVVKPITCRPGNSEQFIFCEKLTPFGATIIKDHLTEVLCSWDDLPEGETVASLVPLTLMKDDARFFDYIYKHNMTTVDRQTRYIQFYLLCARDQRIRVPDSDKIIKVALAHWELKPCPRKGKPRFHQIPDIKAIIAMYADEHWNPETFTAKPSNFNLSDFNAATSFYASELDFPAVEFALVAINSTGTVFYAIDAETGFVETQFTGPPSSIFLVENNPSLFAPDMDQLVIHDAAVLSGDNLADLPFPQRMKVARKFAITAIMQLPEGTNVKLTVPEIKEISVLQITENQKIAESCRISRKDSSFWANLIPGGSWLKD